MLLASDLKKIYQHPSITKCQDVSEIMLPLLKKHGITVFNYYKYCDDGMIRLSTHRAWTEHYFNKGYPSIHTVPSAYLQKDLNYFIWVIDDCPQILRDAAFNFNISNGISIAKKTNNGIEFFCFGTTLNNTSIINNFYLNNLDILLNYCDHFKNYAHTLLKKCAKDKIILLPIQTSIPSKTFLTRRQNDCALLLLKGMKYHEIADKLNLSRRTIETHVEYLRTKLNCRNKSELIIKLSKISLDPFDLN
jgi:DNA-binding CsgD family transcriptional regulator